MVLATWNGNIWNAVRNFSLILVSLAMDSVISLGNGHSFLTKSVARAIFVNNCSARNGSEGLQQAIPLNLEQYVVDRNTITNPAKWELDLRRQCCAGVSLTWRTIPTDQLLRIKSTEQCYTTLSMVKIQGLWWQSSITQCQCQCLQRLE